ncbi:MAG TPA: hypothetical protein DCE23_04395 [Firmicutes bacterium]|nr:hypothetical protein [Bacillota bacterium]
MRDYLVSLEIGEGKAHLSEAEIKGILTEHGKIIETEKGKIETAKNSELTTKETTINELKKQIEGMPTSEDVEALKKQIKDYEDAEAQRKEDEKKAAEQSIREERTNAFFNDVKFASNSAKAGIIAEFNKMDFKYDETSKKFLGATEWLEEQKKNDAGAFLSDVANPTFTAKINTPTSDNSMDSIIKAMGLSEEKNK